MRFVIAMILWLMANPLLPGAEKDEAASGIAIIQDRLKTLEARLVELHAARFYPNEYSACIEGVKMTSGLYKAMDLIDAKARGEKAVADMESLVRRIEDESSRVQTLLESIDEGLAQFGKNGTYDTDTKRVKLIINAYFKGIDAYADYELDKAIQSLSIAKSLVRENSKAIDAMENPDVAYLGADDSGANEPVRKYTVRSIPANRETLWTIAKSVYGDPFLWPLIWRMNKDKVHDPMFIFPGQELLIPSIPTK
jgi:nucleoid-associated protein YgaU